MEIKPVINSFELVVFCFVSVNYKKGLVKLFHMLWVVLGFLNILNAKFPLGDLSAGNHSSSVQPCQLLNLFC